MDYESLYNACEHIRLALAYHNAGLLNEFLQVSTDGVDGRGDMMYASWYDMLDIIMDFFRIGGSEDYCATDLYFSDQPMRDYFRFARRHAAEQGVPFRLDQYYQQARDFVYNTMLAYCPYGCWFRLVSQSHHEYGDGLAIRLYEEFYSYDDMIYGLLDVSCYFRDRAAELAADSGGVLSFPSGTAKKEAA